MLELKPNEHMIKIIVMEVSNNGEGDQNGGSETDSHANMIVVGNESFVFSHSGLSATVKAFSKEAKRMTEVPIVDAVLAYDCPFTGLTYLLVARNALCVPSMNHNLIPPFIMQEAGLVVNETPKIHCDDPTVEDHSIFDEESGLRTPLTLNGIFSVFPTRALTEQEIEEVGLYKIFFLTPDSNQWDPYNVSYN